MLIKWAMDTVLTLNRGENVHRAVELYFAWLLPAGATNDIWWSRNVITSGHPPSPVIGDISPKCKRSDTIATSRRLCVLLRDNNKECSPVFELLSSISQNSQHWGESGRLSNCNLSLIARTAAAAEITHTVGAALMAASDSHGHCRMKGVVLNRLPPTADLPAIREALAKRGVQPLALMPYSPALEEVRDAPPSTHSLQ
jgi:hypothetical protein